MAISSKQNVTIHPVSGTSIFEVGSELKEVIGRLLKGKDSFLIWADVVSPEHAKELLSRWASRIMQAFPTIAEDVISIDNKSKLDDMEAQLYLDLADLCLENNLLTHSATRACLNIALTDLADSVFKRLLKDSEHSSSVRLSMALGILIAKLSCRLKYSKHYVDQDLELEKKVAKKLKML